MFNTGTTAGFCTNLFGSDFQEKIIPSFSWGTPEEYSVYKLEKATATAKAIMQRREVNFKSWHEKLFKKIYELTSDVFIFNHFLFDSAAFSRFGNFSSSTAENNRLGYPLGSVLDMGEV